MSQLVSPNELPFKALVEIVSKLQGRLYLDLDEHGTEFWNPGKEWSCCDICQDIQDLLHEHGLVPGEEQPYEVPTSEMAGSHDPTVQRLTQQVEIGGLRSENLDELVHDCCSATAAEINNRGLAGQIRFLVDQLGASDATAQLTEILDFPDGSQEA